MRTTWEPEPQDLAILRFLRDEAVAERGWQRRGVRGWRFYEEISAGVGLYIPERIPNLAHRGLLDRADTAESWRRRPIWLYRINPQGVLALAEADGVPSAQVPPPGDEDEGVGTIYVPAGAWRALGALKRHADEKLGPLRLGEHGWMFGSEIKGAAGWHSWEHLMWLLRRHLIQRREVPNPDRPIHPAILYHIADLGRAVEVVDAVPSPAGRSEWVQARLPASAGPGPTRGKATTKRAGSRRSTTQAR